MKLLYYRYRLKIELDSPVENHRFTLRCTPVSDARQRVLHCERSIAPADFLSESRDGWGNPLVYGACRAAHTGFEVIVSGQVQTGLAECVPSADPIRDSLFQYPTPLTAADGEIRRFAEGLSLTGDAVHQAERVMNAVHSALRYTPGATTVSTTAAQAFAAGRGVCQDYAHVMLAALRSQKIPCRYVVGMLMGEGKSHAWVEVLDRGNWYGFDPTNNRRTEDGHIKISHGRDYLDCAINRGLFRGTAGQKTEVSVIVSESIQAV